MINFKKAINGKQTTNQHLPNRRNFSIFKLLSLLSLVLLFEIEGVKGQIYLHNFGAVDILTKPYTGAPGTFATNLSASSWTTSATGWSGLAGSSGESLSLSNSSGTPTYTLTFDVAAGFQVAITHFNFWRVRSSTGAPNWTMTINSNSVGSGTTPTTGAALGSTAVTTPISGLTGTVTIILTMSGASGTGTFRLDDFTLTGSVTSVGGPNITQVGTLSTFISIAVSSPSTEQTFTVAGTTLTNDIVVTPPTGYQVSTISGSGFGSTVTLTQSGGTVATTTIYARFNPSTLADQVGGNIACTSTGATTQNVAATGEVTNLSTGAIAFIAFQGATTDFFRIVAMQDIPANTRIWFTDKAWDGNGGTLAFTTGEGNSVWTSPGSIVTQGTVIEFAVSAGTVNLGTGPFTSGLGSAGEQLFAYQGTLTTPTFVAGYTSGTTVTSPTVPTASGTDTWVPAGLTNGTNFVALGGITFGSSYLTAATHNRSLADMRSHIHTFGNLSTTNTSTTSQGSWPSYTFNIIADEPTTQPSFSAATSVGNNNMDLNFSGGNGTSYMVVMREGTAVTATPTDATNYSSVSGSINFSTATELSAGQRIVYNGTTATGTITVTNLSAGTTYHYAIYAYNGTTTTANFYLTTPGTGNQLTTGSANSNVSDIIIHSSFTEPTNIAYASTQENSNLTVGTSVEVAQFTLRDGGAITDGDANSTTLNSITFTIAGHTNLRRLALYDGSTELSEVAITTGTATFSGLTLAAGDNSTKDFSLRASFAGTVTDNSQFSFTVSSATADVAGSTFAAADAGAAASSTTGDRNKIEVTADRLAFVQQPSNVATNIAMSPAPTVSANDALANRDLDYVTDMTATTTGTFGSSTNPVIPVAGLGTFSNLQFSAAATGRTIAVTSGSLTASGNSSTFDITTAVAFGDVIISEISYESTNEWIELHNTTSSSIDISGWYITDHSVYPASSEGDCVIPSSTSIPAGGYLVISTTGTGSSANDLVDITGEILSAAGPRGAANRPQLSNSGDNIALYNAASSGTLIDGSLTVNFPDYSGSSTISIERIAKETWGTAAFGRSGTTFASATYTTSSPGTVGSPILQANVTVTDLATRTGQIINLSNRTLEIGGVISGSGTINGIATSSLTITGASGTINFDQTTPGTTNVLRNLTISGSGTTTLGNALNITGGNTFGVVTVGTGATLATGGNLTLKSDATGTASIGSSLGTISSSVTVERFIASAGRRWRFLASPVQSTTIADWKSQFAITGPGTTTNSIVGDLNSNGWHQTYNNITNNTQATTTSVRLYVEANSASGNSNLGWGNVLTSTPLTPGQGFRTFIRGPISGASDQLGINSNSTTQNSFTILLTGNINSGDVTPLLTNSQTGWNLLGNPYACAYDFNAHFDANIGSEIANIDPNVYVYNGVTNGYNSYNASSGTVNGLTSGIIPSGAGFFIQATGAPTFVFKEAYKTTSTPASLHKSSLSTVDFGIKYSKDSTESDLLVFKMFDGATLNNERFDTKKLNNENLNLSTYGTDNIDLMASCIPFITEETRIKLNVEASEIGTYKFDFTNMDNFDKNVSVSLLDKFTNKTTDVKTNTAYTFEMGAGENQWGKNRFELILNGKATSVLNNNLNNNNLNKLVVYPNPANEVLNISVSNGAEVNNVNIYNVSGKLVNTAKVAANQINISDLNNGVYFIEILTENGKLTTKFVK
jgi:hypothetical protein